MLDANQIYQGDCLKLLADLDDESVDLVFADPPFNIGYEYDEYDDRRTSDDYLDWCERWMCAVSRVLKPNGTFWLAIGDEYAAELKVLAQNKASFCSRSWVIWYYTFGVNCVRGFSRSHTHLFHFVKDPENFTFNSDNPAVRVLSARQLVYADNRANSAGRLPDNTWILRPQDAPAGGFAPSHDTWYYARVAGTFKEREGFHGCQMPEQLLGRIIRVTSNPLDIVVDPFAGSGTTLAVAKKLGRRFIGMEMSDEYVQRVRTRLSDCAVGDELDGPADAVKSAPRTSQGKRKLKLRNGKPVLQSDEATEQGIIAAYNEACPGQPTDFVLCNPDLFAAFVKACKAASLTGNAESWSRLLLRIRKSGKLPKTGPSVTRPPIEQMDPFNAAAEIAMHLVSTDFRLSIDEILCSPRVTKEFDQLASEFAPGFTAFEYRWAALNIRRRASRSKSRGERNCYEWLHCELPAAVPLADVNLDSLERSGVYMIASDQLELYVGEAANVRTRIEQVLQLECWQDLASRTVRFHPLDNRPSRQALQTVLVQRLNPLLNSSLLKANCNSDSAQLSLFDL